MPVLHESVNGPLPTDPSPSRDWLRVVVLGLVTLALVVLCVCLAVPFLPALAWAFALAVVAYPVHRWIERLVPYPNVAASISTFLVVVFLLVPTIFVAARLTVEGRDAALAAKEELAGGRWRDVVSQVPGLGESLAWLEQRVDFEAQVSGAVAAATRDVGGVLSGSLWAGVQMLSAVLVLFFFFRDRDRLLRGIRDFSPLKPTEQEEVSRRVEEAIHATIYGTFVTALLQAVTGALLFWFLGLPGAVLWGAVIFILGVLPFVGAILVWLPFAVFLATEGRIGAAAILAVWGAAMAGPVGNAVYSVAAGGHMRMHPVPALIAYAGGLIVFGITGMVLGPVILALTVAVIDVWKRRAGATPVLGSSIQTEAVSSR